MVYKINYYYLYLGKILVLIFSDIISIQITLFCLQVQASSKMVFESIVVDLINRYVGQFVENLDTSQLKIGIWGGENL